MEYIGEVIPNHEFIRRTKEYEAAGLEHYYFMTLKTDEVHDVERATVCWSAYLRSFCIDHWCNKERLSGKIHQSFLQSQ